MQEFFCLVFLAPFFFGGGGNFIIITLAWGHNGMNTVSFFFFKPVFFFKYGFNSFFCSVTLIGPCLLTKLCNEKAILSDILLSEH